MRQKTTKRHIAGKMRIPVELLLMSLSRKRGKIGRIAAELDSLISRKLDRNKGIYKEL